MGFPGGAAGKESTCNTGDLGLIPGLGRSPGEGKRLPTPVLWPGEFHGLYSPWGHKESDRTERLSLSFTFSSDTLSSTWSQRILGKVSSCLLSELRMDPTFPQGHGTVINGAKHLWKLPSQVGDLFPPCSTGV